MKEWDQEKFENYL